MDTQRLPNASFTGRITNQQGRPLPGLLVRIHDDGPIAPDSPAIGEAVTDRHGRFSARIPPDASGRGGDAAGGVLIRVYEGSRLLDERRAARTGEPTITIDLTLDHVVDDPDEPPRHVSGVVRGVQGQLLPNVTVNAVDRDLRTEQPLGQAHTDHQGAYTIQYFTRQFRRAEKGSADLVVRALDAAGAPLTESVTLFNAPTSAQINLTIPDERPFPANLFERIAEALSSVLEDVRIEDIEEGQEYQDLSFLAGETGFDKPLLARFVMAHRLQRQGLEAEFWFVLLGGGFFEYRDSVSLDTQHAAVLERLSSFDAGAVRQALARGFNQHEIADRWTTRVEPWIEAVLEFTALRSLSDAGRPTLVASALDAAGITNLAKRATFARLFNEHKALTQAMVDTLEKERGFTPAELADLRTSFRLADLTQANPSIVSMLRAELDVRAPERVRLLAKKSKAEWVTLVTEHHGAGTIQIPFEMPDAASRATVPKAEIYSEVLERQFREAFPTAAFAGGLERALRNGGPKGLRKPDVLRRFLDQHEEFELLTTPVDEYLNSDRPDNGPARDDEFRLELKAVQRVFKLAPTFEATDTLLADGVHSGQQIYRLGETEFVRRYETRAGFTPDIARRAWGRAASTHAAVLTIVGDLKALEGEALPLVLKQGAAPFDKFPNWNNLFKGGDLCECEHCRSVLSPAAYFADLLMFLRDRSAVPPATTVKDILFARRPDLGYLELNCENALTTLPYIDVVCEVLEDVIAAGANDLELPGFTTMPVDPATAHAQVEAAFDAQGISLGDSFTLSQVVPSNPDLWVAHGSDVTYLLKKKSTPNFFAETLRNTKASAEELRAYPQYVNPHAYATLRAARYPMRLPFDLFAEEVRAAFQKANVKRWDLMRTLRGAAPANPADRDIAAEYFGISADPSAAFDEQRLILTADPTVAAQQAVWGETGASWLADVGNVKNFLGKTSLEYNDVLALLDLPFINPAGDIAIHHLDPSCDTDQKVIQVLDATKLDRIHRFLRLWRKLKGWKMWELDLVIRHPRIGNGALNGPFLVALFYFSQLKSRLGPKATVEHVAALFGDLNTETRFTKPHAKRETALYQKLFLNKRVSNPLDAAFEIDSLTGDVPPGQTITAHHPVVLGAVSLREADVITVEQLVKASDGLPYIADVLTLANLSFVWRHAWLSKSLGFKAEEWKTLLKLFDQDMPAFVDPAAAWTFVEQLGHLKACGFSVDELNWLLAADPSAKAAVKEADAVRFLAALRKALQDIRAEYDAAQYPFLASTPPTDVDALTGLLTALLQKLNRDEAAAQFFLATVRDEVTQEQGGGILPADYVFPLGITDANHIRIRYDHPTLRFTGVMTPAERLTLLTDPSLAPISGIAAYQDAIDEFFHAPRLALKFFEPVFTAPLATLPAGVDFNTLVDADLARRISYDAERRLLRYAGILSPAPRDALDQLSADLAYRNAVNSLATQPALIAPPDERIWLVDADLVFPLRDLTVPANDHLAENLATAVTKALAYLSKTLSEAAVVEQSSAQLGLTEAMTRRLLSEYAVLPDTLLAHLTGPFAATVGVIDYATLGPTFDAWYWAHRSASVLKKWKITLDDWQRLTTLAPAAQLLEFLTLPLNTAAPVAPIDRVLRTNRLLRVRDSAPETQITFLEVLTNLGAGTYATPAAFAADVERVNESWLAADVDALIASLDLTYPADYLLAESWERLRQAFSFLASLNATAATATTFAEVAMTLAHATSVKELLRARFGAETWLTLCAEIQDVLRERKRDALAAYILTELEPPDPPSDKWENTNDLYAYYLLDVEMSSCQLTSRLVQGSGSIQLFVQRCFMGLEPAVEVNADGPDADSAWRWWTWMRKYRVWEANRKVFLWPENWIEPELKKDRSPFFKDLENELLQNDINPVTVETAFSNYLEKLRGVAQLEIAGLYQQDDGDNTIVHVFGRTPGAEPHLYYYRRFDYRQWTPWEKVELDIEGDYLIPAVIGTRLFLFWPVFTEVPDEEKNSTVTVPKFDVNSTSSFDVDKAFKRLRMKMAVSDYRQGKWTPKRVSTDYHESPAYNVEISRRHYKFMPIDGSRVDGRFVVEYEGSSLGSDNKPYATMSGAFEVAGCKGVPEQTTNLWGNFVPAVRAEWDSTGYRTTNLKWIELRTRHDAPSQDFTLQNYVPGPADYLYLTPLLAQTPWTFHMTPPWHLSYLDTLLFDGKLAFPNVVEISRMGVPLGGWSPFFYNDKKRTFFVLPCAVPRRERRPGRGEATPATPPKYYPEIKKSLRQMEDVCESLVASVLDGIDLSALTPAERQALDELLWKAFPEEASPPSGGAKPYTDGQIVQVRELLRRWLMRFFHYWLGLWASTLLPYRQFHFKNHYHPFVCDFAKLVYNPLTGIPGLMRRETQLRDTGFDFQRTYQPTSQVVQPGTEAFYPREMVDFEPDGAYAPYNWELFFHAPLLVANSLSRNQRFEEAREWYHFIFNPIGVASPVPGGSSMSKYWITKPFFETRGPEYVKQRIENILRMLAGDTSVPGYSAQAKAALDAQVLDWRTNPFEPHRIANYRTVAYQKTVVMKYLDNLIAWGDNLFRQDSMESTNEATQLYILAAELLGPRPKKIPPRAVPPVESFNELEFQFDTFSNALIEVENLVPQVGDDLPDADPAPLPMLYFCIPHNDKMLEYWDTIADRLYKLRHCMNIEGVVRQLALFEPPIDPGLLVKAVAGGIDISSALADLNAPLPLYRFSTLLQRANEVCTDVRTLGGELLGSLEKKDSEALARLRQDQELRLLNAVKTVRETQIAEANENLASVKKNKELIAIRRDYYRKIEKINKAETLQQKKLADALDAQQISQVINVAASTAHIVPSFDVGGAGAGGSPKATVMFGGPNVGSALQATAGGFLFWANVENYHANKAAINAGHDRRWDDWKHQERLADKELEQIDKAIAASELRIALAEKELENHVLQIENAKATDAFMRSKYTNQELYQWQIGQIAGVYFQSYRLAYDLAKRAERCLRFELGLADSSYINFGYWDSLKKGLLAGEKLQYDLRRLEMAYIEQNRREFELTKNVSLALVDPLALVMLRETGRCFIRLREELFDLDFPGHYFRRIKSVSLTLPCVVGPYTTIASTLRLVKNSIRIRTAIGDDYARNVDDDGLPADDDRFIENNIPVKAVAVSNAQNDSGVFELNFRDERYLPFEGAGAISEWSLELFNDLPSNDPNPGNPDFGRPLRQFDYTTIADAILHVKYTAREDAGAFKNAAVGHLREYFGEDGTTPLVRMIDLKRELPAEWHRFLHPANPATGNVFAIEMTRHLFRLLDEGKTIKINSISLLARCMDPGNYDIVLSPLPPPPPPESNRMTLAKVAKYGGLHFSTRAVDALAIELPPTGPPEIWELKMTRPGGGNLELSPVQNAAEVEDLMLVLGYEWNY